MHSTNRICAENPPGSSRRIEEWVHLIALGVFLVFLGCWISLVIMDPDVIQGRDWQAFDTAASRYWLGDGAQVYSFAGDASFHFLYPPFLLIPLAPLAWLPELPSYALCVAVAALCLAAFFWSLLRFLPARSSQHKAVVSVVLCSAPCISLLPTAQLSAFYCLAILSGFLAWQRRQEFLAGLMLALLCVKPNIAVPMLVLLSARKQWRILSGFLSGVGLLVSISLPLGAGLWQQYYDVVTNMSELTQSGSIAFDKQITLFACLSFFLEDNVSASTIKIGWATLIMPLGIALLSCWWKPGYIYHLPRLLSLTVLFIVAANPYMFFYDGLLLAIPASIWYLSRQSYHSERRWFFCGVMFALTYVWLFNLYLPLLSLPLFFVGLPVAAWLAVDAWDYLTLPRSPDRMNSVQSTAANTPA